MNALAIGTGGQIPLELPHRPALGRADFLVSPSNATAAEMLARPADWPRGRLALIGPESAGKTHLAHVWMRESGAILAAASCLDPDQAPALAARGAVVIEDADRLGEMPDRAAARRAEDGLFHLFNLMGAEGGRLLVTGRTPPAGWRLETPDLASRLASLTVVRISPPDDALLAAVLAKHFADRQLDVAPDVVAFLAARIERSFAAAERAAGILDRAALADRRRITRPFAARLIAEESPGDGA